MKAKFLGVPISLTVMALWHFPFLVGWLKPDSTMHQNLNIVYFLVVVLRFQVNKEQWHWSFCDSFSDVAYVSYYMTF
jgi:hypothetical protein